MEAFTDPDITAYYDPVGGENGDMCAWSFGPDATTLPNGAAYNVKLGARRYLLQQIWVNKVR